MKKCLLYFFFSTCFCGISFAQQEKPATAKQKASPKSSKTSPRKTDAQLYAEQLKAEAKPVKAKSAKQ